MVVFSWVRMINAREVQRENLCGSKDFFSG